MHGIEGHAEAAGEETTDGVKVEQRLHQRRIVGHRVDDLDHHIAHLLRADTARSMSGVSVVL